MGDITDKKSLRKAMRAARTGLSDIEARELSLAAQRHIIADAAWERAASVGLYIAVRKEADTELLCNAAWDSGKDVYLPYIPGTGEGVMDLLPCHRNQALETKHFGIPEPSPEMCPPAPEGGWVPEIIIVPGVAFSAAGYRVGSGGGYYDRFFARPALRNTVRIALAYSFQVVPAVPVEKWDTRMHAIATEEGITWL